MKSNDVLPSFQSASEIVIVAALVLLALFATIIGFPFWPALGFSFALGVVFYLLQTGGGKKEDRDKQNDRASDPLI
ncbi:MAG: hypothetical protein NTW14_10410 [bacterium]|nr:hypothetical protein [bacterium]